MGKFFGIVLILAAFYVGYTIYSEGTENAFGGILSPVESVRDPGSFGATGLTPLAMEADLPAQPRSRAGPVTQGVRDRLNGSGRR